MSTEPENAELRTVSEEEIRDAFDAWNETEKDDDPAIGALDFNSFAIGYRAADAIERALDAFFDMAWARANGMELTNRMRHAIEVAGAGVPSRTEPEVILYECAEHGVAPTNLPDRCAIGGERDCTMRRVPFARLVAAPGGRAEEAEAAEIVRDWVSALQSFDGSDNPKWKLAVIREIQEDIAVRAREWVASHPEPGARVAAPGGRAEEAERALTFDEVRATNVTRCERWHPGFPNDGWTGADWSNAMAGEAGEACNVVKKLRRIDHGVVGAVDPEADTLRAMLADELADTFLYLDLLGAHYGIDLADAVVRKFNAISDREGFPDRLRAASPLPTGSASAREDES